MTLAEPELLEVLVLQAEEVRSLVEDGDADLVGELLAVGALPLEVRSRWSDAGR